MNRLVLSCLVVSFLWSVPGCAVDDETCSECAPPQIVTEPGSLHFGEGAASVATIAVVNRGTRDLVVDGVEVAGRDAASYLAAIVSGETVVRAGGELDVEVTYAGGNASTAAILTLISNDPDEGRLEVPLTSGDFQGDGRLVVTPNPIEFGPVLVGEKKAIEVTLLNVSSSPMEITRLSITGSPDFYPEEGTRDEALQAPENLAPEGSSTLTLSYEPPQDGRDLGQFIVEYPVGSEIRTLAVDMSANVGSGNAP